MTNISIRHMGRHLGCVVLATFLVSACTTNPYTGQKEASNAGKGAGIGAAAGAVIGAIAGGGSSEERRKKALIGAGIGALGGAGVGAYMDSQESKLREQLAGSGVSVTRMGDNIVLNMPGNITFPTNQFDVKSDFYPVLNSVALVLKEYNKTLIDVVGHTDSTGAHAYNMDLSRKRADSVGRYLQSQGVDSMRVVTQGMGPDYPVAGNDSEAGKQQNRRVELVLRPLTA